MQLCNPQSSPTSARGASSLCAGLTGCMTAICCLQGFYCWILGILIRTSVQSVYELLHRTEMGLHSSSRLWLHAFVTHSAGGLRPATRRAASDQACRTSSICLFLREHPTAVSMRMDGAGRSGGWGKHAPLLHPPSPRPPTSAHSQMHLHPGLWV